MDVTFYERDVLSQVSDLLHGKKSREDLIPLLQQVQKRLGYLPEAVLEEIAAVLQVLPVEVFGAATFYNHFRLHPPGENEIKVCLGTACYMVGGRVALESFARRLGIQEGEITPDGKFSLERVACVGCCAMAPVVVVNGRIEKHVTPTRVDGILLSFELPSKHTGKEAGCGKGEEVV